jgi:hypothetical protein
VVIEENMLKVDVITQEMNKKARKIRKGGGTAVVQPGLNLAETKLKNMQSLMSRM